MMDLDIAMNERALCRGDLALLQAQLAAAKQQIDDLKKAAAAKDEPKGQN